MSKWQAIKRILLCSNYVVITDVGSCGSISPLYSDQFIERLRIEQDGLRLVQRQHEQMLDKIANEELGEL